MAGQKVGFPSMGRIWGAIGVVVMGHVLEDVRGFLVPANEGARELRGVTGYPGKAKDGVDARVYGFHRFEFPNVDDHSVGVPHPSRSETSLRRAMGT